MRSCADPAMTKDACAWGASVGVSSALLAARGFTSVRPEFLDTPLDDLGERWRVHELYIKAYPCCRWSQGAIAAALEVRGGPLAVTGPDAGTGLDAVEAVRVRTFAAADGLAQVPPSNTEEAQYNLAWPVACALVHGDFGVEHVLGPFDDPAVCAMFERVVIEVDPAFDAEFPARRLTAVELELRDGTRREAGPMEAPGEPDDPGWEELIASKVARLIGGGRDAASEAGDPAPAGLGACGAPELIRLLCGEHG
jgi:2-methylcitrate dehydratase PrpD